MNLQGLTRFRAADEAVVRKVVELAEKEGVWVVGVQELWFKSKRNLEEVTRALKGTPWRWYGKIRTQSKRKDKKGSGGVGMFVHENAGHVVEHKCRSDGLMRVELTRGNVATNVVNVYLVPSNSTRYTHNENAMKELEDMLARMPKDRRVVMGDWNARIGEMPSVVFTQQELEGGEADDMEEEAEYARASVDKVRNPAGKAMIDTMNAHGMVIVNGIGCEMQYTQRGALGFSVVDYVAVSHEMMGETVSVRVVEGSDVELCSDHAMVVASGLWGPLSEEQEELKTDSVTTTAPTRTIWARKSGAEGREQWEEACKLGEAEMSDFVREWSQAASRGGDVDVGSTWERYRMKVVAVQEETIGRKVIRARKCQGKWYQVYDTVLQGIKKEARVVLCKLKKQRRAGGDVRRLHAEYVALRVQAKARLKHVIKERAVQVVQGIERLKEGDPKAGWRALKDIIGMGVVKGAKLSVVLDAQGRECRGEEAKKAIRDAYAALGIDDMLDKDFDVELARMTRLHVRRMEAERIEQDDLDKRFEITEVQATIKALVAGKASGEDDILVEWLKYGKEQMTYALWLLCNLVWASEKPPKEWSKGVITLLYKDGDKRDPLNYRGITLLSVVGKVFMRMVNNRLAQHCEAQVLQVDEQAGFRKGRCCADQIFILSEVLAQRRQANQKVAACFIDVRKAYDRVWRDGLWAALWQKGVRGKMWRVLWQYYQNVQSAVMTHG